MPNWAWGRYKRILMEATLQAPVIPDFAGIRTPYPIRLEHLKLNAAGLPGCLTE